MIIKTGGFGNFRFKDLKISTEGLQDRINAKPRDIDIFLAHDAISEGRLLLIKEALKPGEKVPVINTEDIHIIVYGSITGYPFDMSNFRTAHKTRLTQEKVDKRSHINQIRLLNKIQILFDKRQTYL
jgi:hypothetical protein